MRKIFVGIGFAGLGFWIGANRLLPIWVVVVLAVVSGACWGVATWMEWREGQPDDES